MQPLLAAAWHDIAADRPVMDALIDQVRALCRMCARNRRLTSAFYAAASEYSIKIGQGPTRDDEADPRMLAPIDRGAGAAHRVRAEVGELRP